MTPETVAVKEIKLNKEQQDAVQLGKWLSGGPNRVGVLSGPAGTGKTTSLKALCDEIGEVILLSPTNRAALVATKLSGRPATTIHLYLYHPKVDKETGELRFERRMDLVRPKSGVIIIDESSLVNKDITKDLMRVMVDIDVSLLFVGDSFQILPVIGDWSVFNQDFVDFVTERDCEFKRVNLIKVWRQALESPILRAATDIRENPRDWKYVTDVLGRDCFKQYNNVPKRIDKWLKDGVDYACLVYTHAARNRINRAVRLQQGYAPDLEPQAGEPMLIRKNDYTIGVCNGETVPFKGFVDGPNRPPAWGRYTYVNDKLCLVSTKGILYDKNPDPQNLRGLPYPFIEMSFGHARTTHAAQGSEFERVILNWEDGINYMGLPERSQWVYTGLTRAREQFAVGWSE